MRDEGTAFNSAIKIYDLRLTVSTLESCMGDKYSIGYPFMLQRLTVLSFLLVCASNVSAEGLEPFRASSAFHWPPAFEAMFGDPEIKVGRSFGGKERTEISGAGTHSVYYGIHRFGMSSRVVVRADSLEDPSEFRMRAARALAKRFYEKVFHPAQLTRYERLLSMRELISLDERSFVDLASEMLIEGSTGDGVQAAWWRVRMGTPSQTDSLQKLVIINLHYEKEDGSDGFGHFCFGLRQPGGAADADLLLDFRAPWYSDERADATEAVNLHNRLKIASTTNNLYDWLYTQTEHRGCRVDCWFLPVTRDQVTLIHHFAHERVPHEGGNFRPFRKNCASLGQLFLNRLEPLTEKATAGRPLTADLPIGMREKFVGKHEDVVFFEISDITRKLGRKPTPRSHIFSASPSRAGSRPFLLLKSAGEVN